jgi:hypothetical protein
MKKFLDKSPSITYRRKVIGDKIRDLFKNEFHKLFLEKGLLSLLIRYMASSQAKIHQIIENWPREIEFKRKLYYNNANYQMLTGSFDKWRISNDHLPYIVALQKSKRKPAKILSPY